MIRFADYGDIPRLKKIWKESFDDSDCVIDMFFDSCFGDAEALVFCVGKDICSALYMIPTAISGRPASYIYAASTLPEHRGRGFMSELMRSAVSLSKEKGDSAVFLVPANVSLYDYYARFGFERGFYVNRTELSASDIPQSDICVFDAGARYVFDMRGRGFAGLDNAVSWNYPAIEFAVRSADRDDERFLGFDGGYAWCRRTESDVVIRELVCPDEMRLTAVGAVKKAMPAENYIVERPCDAVSDRFCRGMMIDFDKKFVSDGKPPLYIGITMN
jgi:GNAT superfamily N-acetyltransferase